MFVDTDLLDGARTTFRALFDSIIGGPQNQWGLVATTIPSDSAKYTANWIGAPPQLRTFKGTLEFGKLFPHDYTVTIEEHAVGIQVKLRDLRLDKLGAITRTIRAMMVQASKYYDKLAYEALSDGFTLLCYDGKAFYADNHSVGDAGTHDNKTNAVFSETAYDAGWVVVNTAKDDAGQPMGLVVTQCVVHPTNRGLAKKTLEARTISTGGENVYAGDAQVVSAPYLKTTTEWHLVAGGAQGAENAILLFETLPIDFVANDDPAGTTAFRERVVEYKVEAEVSPGYGLFQQAYGSTGA